MTNVLIALLLSVASILAVLAYTLRKRCDVLAFNNKKLKALLLDTHDQWASDSRRFMDRLEVGRARMSKIAEIVSRRPPRRKWLADARNIAKIASDSI